MSLQGLLEYPVGATPHPVMLFFTQDAVGLGVHPLTNIANDEDVKDMCAADDELRRRYGDKVGAKMSPSQRLKLKLRAKKKRFDSADWALSLQSNSHDEDSNKNKLSQQSL